MTEAPPPVTVVMSMLNAETTVLQSLRSMAGQRYPIREILVFDNGSRDRSVELVEEFARTCPIPIRVVRNSPGSSIGDSCRAGVSMAQTPLVVLAHSDTVALSPDELERLTAPMRDDPGFVASRPRVLMPREVWEGFSSFWQKRLFVRAVGTQAHGFAGKFDCIRRDAYLAVGGHDTERFTHTCGYGGEDTDLGYRLRRVGRLAGSEARVVHMHYAGGNFPISELFRYRMVLERAYGKILRFQRFSLLRGNHLLLVRPILALLPFVPGFHLAGLVLLVGFAFLNSSHMYSSRKTLADPRILVLPFLDILLVYLEAFWFLEGMVTPPYSRAGAAPAHRPHPPQQANSDAA